MYVRRYDFAGSKVLASGNLALVDDAGFVTAIIPVIDDFRDILTDADIAAQEALSADDAAAEAAIARHFDTRFDAF